MIDPSLVIEAMEEILARGPPSPRYGADLDIRVKIDRKTGRRPPLPACAPGGRRKELENEKARADRRARPSPISDDPKVGDTIVDEVPPVEMGRIAAQTASR